MIGDPVQRQIFQNENGVSRDALNFDQVSNLILSIPPLPEQRAIVAFLDRETGRIDAMIEKKRRLIELLEEKRTALISHAVTKGLNPNAPMKDSGIEWLGEIPAGWEVKKITHFCQMIVDGTHFSPPSDMVGDFLYITAKNIKEYGVELRNVTYISEQHHREIYVRCPVVKGDVLYIKDGATAGVATVNQIEEPFSLLSSVALIRPESDKYLPKFLAYHLNERSFKGHVLNKLVGGAMTRFTIEIIKQYRMVTPSLREQHRIVSHLDQETSKIDTLIAKNHEVIEKLQEYRTALISAAVTGKIDVRKAG